MNHILVIDDEQGISDLIREALSRFGYMVKTASNGQQGLQRLEETDFDLVVTDMNMPDLNGAFIVRHVRRSSRPRTPVIGISGTPWLLQGVDCDAVLPKPFHLQDLVDTIKRLDTVSLSASTLPFGLNPQPVWPPSDNTESAQKACDYSSH